MSSNKNGASMAANVHSTAGRNDPCPCGSGKKHKKCCLLGEVPTPDELLWRRLHDANHELIGKLLQHTVKTYGEAAIFEGWDEFHLWENEEPFDPKSPQLPLFFPWFYSYWTPDHAETEVDESAPLDLPPLESLLKTKKRQLSELEIECLEAVRERSLTFLDVLEVESGNWVKVQDVLTGESHVVREKAGSRSMKVGDILFGRVVTVRGLSLFDGLAPIVFPPSFKTHVIDLRRDFRDKLGRSLNVRTLRKFHLELLDVYWQFYQALHDPPAPVLQNTDGDPLIPHKMIFEIESPEAAFDALSSLCFAETKEELKEAASFDRMGRLHAIEFPWLKKGNKKHKGWDNTVLGHISIDGRKMIVEVNSEKRSEKFLALLKKNMPHGWSLKETQVEEIDVEKLQQERVDGSRDVDAEADRKRQELMNDPEVQAHLASMAEKHWEHWPRERLPALGGRRPIDAVKSSEGREAVEALLMDFERRAQTNPLPGQTVETFKNLRDRLGLGD